MEYSAFKALQLLLFFSTPVGFALWQLISVRRELSRDRSSGPCAGAQRGH